MKSTESYQISEICTKSITGSQSCERYPIAAYFGGLGN